jgi:hypothetical protein
MDHSFGKDVKLQTRAVDISPEILRIAETALYTSESSELAFSSLGVDARTHARETC